MSPHPNANDALGVACCDTCGAIWCDDLPRERRDHRAFHALVVDGWITPTPIGQGPLRFLRPQIRRARMARALSRAV